MADRTRKRLTAVVARPAPDLALREITRANRELIAATQQREQFRKRLGRAEQRVVDAKRRVRQLVSDDGPSRAPAPTRRRPRTRGRR